MTAVEWLAAIIKHCERFGTNIEQKDIEQAKAMEKEQIIDAYHINPQESKWENIGINYYTETYGSKGKDNHIVDTNEMIDHIGDANKMVEISDEEITKLANEHILYNDSKRQWVVEGMKLYREQLKLRQ